MQFDKFKDYMHYLLHYPIQDNQFFILFTITGNIMDQVKATMFEIRKQANILTATGKYLDQCGRDRQMPRLRSEDDESYRKRLMMKVEIAMQAGTERGMLLMLESLGYEKSEIEPVYVDDPERWAEFIIYLGSKYPSKVRDLAIIHDEVMKIKQASAKPADYGIQESTDLVLVPHYEGIYFKFIYCDEIVCGEHPGYNNTSGFQFSSSLSISTFGMHESPYPLTGTIAASESIYQHYPYALGAETAATIGLYSKPYQRKDLQL